MRTTIATLALVGVAMASATSTHSATQAQVEGKWWQHNLCYSFYNKNGVKPHPHNFARFGWHLMRRVKRGNAWHPATDNAMGTQAYGRPMDGHPSSNAHSANRTFSRKYSGWINNRHWGKAQMMFTSGTMQSWLQTHQDQVLHKFGSNQRRHIWASSIGNNYNARWYNRKGVREDPWVSLRDHWTHNRTTNIYGENSFRTHIHGTIPRTQNGANVYIRLPRHCTHGWVVRRARFMKEHHRQMRVNSHRIKVHSGNLAWHTKNKKNQLAKIRALRKSRHYHVSKVGSIKNRIRVNQRYLNHWIHWSKKAKNHVAHWRRVAIKNAKIMVAHKKAYHRAINRMTAWMHNGRYYAKKLVYRIKKRSQMYRALHYHQKKVGATSAAMKKAHKSLRMSIHYKKVAIAALKYYHRIRRAKINHVYGK